MDSSLPGDEMLEQYADWLDNLEKNEPEKYKELMQELAASAGAKAKDHASPAEGADDLTDKLQQILMASGSEEADFSPKLPGGNIMTPEGIRQDYEGIEIIPDPAFVVKTKGADGKKIFINVCQSEHVKGLSKKVQIDDQNTEQEGINIPLSLGEPHEETDKSGEKCLAFDVVVNPAVISDAKEDKSGSFRNFICEVSLQYVEQKYKMQLDRRFKLPKLRYKGAAPRKQRIRKQQAPVIEEVDPAERKPLTKSSKASPQPLIAERKVKPPVARKQIHYRIQKSTGGTVEECTRIPTVEGGPPLTRLELEQEAPVELIVTAALTEALKRFAEVKVTVAAELLTIKAEPYYYQLELFLPYPVLREETLAALDRSTGELTVTLPVNRTWSDEGPDEGSAPWLLAAALEREQESNLSPAGTDTASTQPALPQLTSKDAVEEEEELPEDRFHQRDMISMHYIEERRREAERKRQEASRDREERKKEAERKKRAAAEAGKSWAEMYPGEPEVEFLDLNDILKDQIKASQTGAESGGSSAVPTQYTPSNHAQAIAAVWEKRLKDLRSANASKQQTGKGEADVKTAIPASPLAFELL